MNDDFADTLRDLLTEPPTQLGQGDDALLAAKVTHLVRRRRRVRTLAGDGLAAAAVTAGILVPTALSSAPRHGGQTPAATAAPTATAIGPQLPESTIVKAIMKAAIADGDASPTAIQYVQGNRGPLVKFVTNGDELMGADATTRVVLVQAVGNFTVPALTQPGQGNHTVTGTSIFVVLDEATGQPLDSGVNFTTVDLSPLGHLVHLNVPK